MTWPNVNLAMFLLDTTQCLFLNLNIFVQFKLFFYTKVNNFSEHDDDDGGFVKYEHDDDGVHPKSHLWDLVHPYGIVSSSLSSSSSSSKVKV